MRNRDAQSVSIYKTTRERWHASAITTTTNAQSAFCFDSLLYCAAKRDGRVLIFRDGNDDLHIVRNDFSSEKKKIVASLRGYIEKFICVFFFVLSTM